MPVPRPSPRRSLGVGGSRNHLRAHRPALPAGEPFPIPADVRLRTAFDTGRHELPAVSLRFAASGGRAAAAQSPFAFRRLRPVPFSPSPFLCHIEFLSPDASDLVIVKRYQSGEPARNSCTNFFVGGTCFLRPRSQTPVWERTCLRSSRFVRLSSSFSRWHPASV